MWIIIVIIAVAIIISAIWSFRSDSKKLNETISKGGGTNDKVTPGNNKKTDNSGQAIN